MVVGGDHFYVKFWVKRTVLERKRRFSIDIRQQRLAVTSSTKFQLTLIKGVQRA